MFQYKDHLGNIRVSYTKNAQNIAEILEEDNYYPFGLKHKGYNDYAATSNNYKYNGKEMQDELGLNMYDYGARNYDPALGRWMNIDPLAEKSRRFNPYVYALDDPIRFIDPDGMEAKDWFKNQAGKVVWFDSKAKKFESGNGDKWSNIGSNTNQVKKSLKVPTQNKTNSWKTISFSTESAESGGKSLAVLKPIVFKNTAVVSYDLNISNTTSTGQLISGKSEITGVTMNAQVSSETSAPGREIQGISGFFGIKDWTPMGRNFTFKSSPFQDHTGPMLSNSPYHATSDASMSMSLSAYSKFTNTNPPSSGLNLSFQTGVDTSERGSIGPNELFNTSP